MEPAILPKTNSAFYKSLGDLKKTDISQLYLPLNKTDEIRLYLNECLLDKEVSFPRGHNGSRSHGSEEAEGILERVSKSLASLEPRFFSLIWPY